MNHSGTSSSMNDIQLNKSMLMYMYTYMYSCICMTVTKGYSYKTEPFMNNLSKLGFVMFGLDIIHVQCMYSVHGHLDMSNIFHTNLIFKEKKTHTYFKKSHTKDYFTLSTTTTTTITTATSPPPPPPPLSLSMLNVVCTTSVSTVAQIIIFCHSSCNRLLIPVPLFTRFIFAFCVQYLHSTPTPTNTHSLTCTVLHNYPSLPLSHFLTSFGCTQDNCKHPFGVCFSHLNLKLKYIHALILHCIRLLETKINQ